MRSQRLRHELKRDTRPQFFVATVTAIDTVGKTITVQEGDDPPMVLPASLGSYPAVDDLVLVLMNGDDPIVLASLATDTTPGGVLGGLWSLLSGVLQPTALATAILIALNSGFDIDISQAGGGDVRLASLGGGDTRIEATGGDIKLTMLSGGDIRLSALGGSLILNSTGGDLDSQVGNDYNFAAANDFNVGAGNDINLTAGTGHDCNVGGTTTRAVNLGHHVGFFDETSATGPVGNVVGKVPIYNGLGTVVGYLPVYDAIS